MAAITMMDPSLRGSQPRLIPLECVLCPKRPSFSDISHLLTHVSSKSHLHHKFNIEFQAKTEADANETLERYLTWYHENGIETLLADRLSSKEHKRTGRRGRPRVIGATGRPSTRQQRPSIKTDPDDVFTDAHTLPPVGIWNTSAARRPLHQVEPSHDVFLDDSLFHTTSIKRGASPYTLADSPIDPFHLKYERSQSITETSDSLIASEVTTTVATENADEDNQASKLKGVIWPGMDLFDSATPDQKRKRNQRKDNSVLEHMKQTSQAVTATEFIWGLDGEYQRSRDIYASPSIDGSPMVKPSRKKQPDAPLASPTKAFNGQRPKHTTKAEGKATKKRRGRQPLADATTTRQTRASTRAAGQVKQSASQSESKIETGDRNIKRESRASKSKRGANNTFDVFKEEPTRSPGRTESPVEENRFDHPTRSALQPINPNILLASPTLSAKQAPLRFFNHTLEPSSLGYRHHSAPYPHSFLGGTHNLTSGMTEGTSFNPLCSQSRLGYSSYPHYNSSIYDDGTKDLASPLDSNSTRLDFGSFNLAQPANPYASSNQRHTADFDI